MSRVGKKPIEVPDGVSVEQKDGIVTVNGPNGSESQDIKPGIKLQLDEKILTITLEGDENDKKLRGFHGLYRSLIANMVTGVSKGFEKDLEILGVGYRAIQQNNDVQFQLGFSHPIVFTPPDGITVEVIDQTKIKVKGKNKQQVGQVAANIRKLRPPEPYKGKGIRYLGEYVRKKAGKAGKA